MQSRQRESQDNLIHSFSAADEQKTLESPEVSGLQKGPSAPRPVRVAIVGPSLRCLGGQSVQADLLMRHWQGDPAVEARFIPIDPEMPRRLRWVEKIPWLRTVIRPPFYLSALWKGMKNAEIVHIFSASHWSFLLTPLPAWLVARMRGKKTLIHYHSGEARNHLRRSRVARSVLRRTDRLVVPSGFLVDVVHEFGLDALVASNIIDSSRFSYLPRCPVRPLLLFTRGFHPHYGVDLVMRAFAHVRAQSPSARLCMLGPGTLEGGIRALARELKVTGVEFAGPTPRERISDFYHQFDIFVNGSWVDNVPVTILEAFACGNPVVSTAFEGAPYFIEHERTGLLCPLGDWRGLGENVLRLLREPDLAQRLAQNAYEESARYRWSAVRPEWLQIYRLLEGSGWPGVFLGSRSSVSPG